MAQVEDIIREKEENNNNDAGQGGKTSESELGVVMVT